MTIVTICGFLGSGKTSLLLALVKNLSDSGCKIAIIENEVGERGIDGEFLESEGFPVREIYSGCVCCSLRHDLTHTLLELERTIEPDIVFLEPSGVAGPKQIRNCLLGYGGEVERTVFVTVVDAVRMPAIRDFSIPLIQDGVEIADVLVINKCDVVDSEQLRTLRLRLSLPPNAHVVDVSATTGRNLDRLVDLVKTLAVEPRTVAVPDSSPVPSSLPEAVVFAQSVTLNSPCGDIAAVVGNRLSRIAQSVGSFPGSLVGHLKAIVKTDPLGYAVFSVTAQDSLPSRKGRLPENPVNNLSVTVNAIVYGVPESDFLNLCRREFSHLVANLGGE